MRTGRATVRVRSGRTAVRRTPAAGVGTATRVRPGWATAASRRHSRTARTAMSSGTTTPAGTSGTSGTAVPSGHRRGSGHTGPVGAPPAADTVGGADSAGTGASGARPGHTGPTGHACLPSHTGITGTGTRAGAARAAVRGGRDTPSGLILGARVGAGAFRPAAGGRAVVRIWVTLGRSLVWANPLGFRPFGV
jgi:hypothetical protein